MFGHIKGEWSTFLKKQKKGLFITWSNSNDESEGETTNRLMVFTRKYEPEGESSDEDMSDEKLFVTYRLL